MKFFRFFIVLIFLLSALSTKALAQLPETKLQFQKEKKQLLNQLRQTNLTKEQAIQIRSQLRILVKDFHQKKQQQRSKKKLRPVKLIRAQKIQNVATVQPSFITTGKASFYAEKFNGRKTASGAIFSNRSLTAAHKTLPFGTRVRVTNINNGKTVEVVINDRGPHIEGRIIDLSTAAFAQLDNLSRGIIEVQIEIIE